MRREWGWEREWGRCREGMGRGREGGVGGKVGRRGGWEGQVRVDTPLY